MKTLATVLLALVAATGMALTLPVGAAKHAAAPQDSTTLLDDDASAAPERVSTKRRDEFAELAAQLAARKTWNLPRLEKEVLRPDALLLPADQTPVDVVRRRTAALLHYLLALPSAPALGPEAADLASMPADSSPATFAKLTALRRRIAFKNPLLDFDKIVFLKHNKQVRGTRHMVDQYFGFNAEKAGGVYVLEKPFGPQPVVRTLLEKAGAFISLDLDYDGKTVLFAFSEADHNLPAGVTCDTKYWTESEAGRQPDLRFYYFRDETCYHLFRMNVDGSGAQQLTRGPWNDFDPCFLPNGRITFISTRAGGQCRCGPRPDPTYTLFGILPDGQDIIQLSFHDTNEWQPSVDNNGMLVYTRWDYIDRDSDVAHHIWQCFPDGRDPRSLHGNYPDRRELRPWMEMSIRAIPHSPKYIAVAAPHHGAAYGSLVLIDPRVADDRATAQLKRLTPEVPFPESESAPGVPHDQGANTTNAEVYGTPWPLSEDFYLCVYDTAHANYGLYLVDSFGNRELLYRDAKIACLDPIPLRPRPCPPVIPSQTTQALADAVPSADPSTGTVMLLNVYESALPWPEKTQIKALRVINVFPKDTAIANEPPVGVAAEALCRGVLGTVPVAPDGSAYFKVPTGASIYFQALDENGMAVQTMRSATYLHPGENLTCIGCHESKASMARNVAETRPAALQRTASELQPEVSGSYPLTFPRLVQPVLDHYCVACHDANRNKNASSLHGDRFVKNGWSEAFQALRKYAWGMNGGNGAALKQRQYSIPGQDGARVSKLYRLLAQGHYDVKLAPADLHRITLWLDCNSNFYGAYHATDQQARGAIVAPKEGLPKWRAFETLVR